VNVTSSFPNFRYQLRSKVEMDNVSEDFDVVHTEPSTEEPEARLIGWGQGTDHAAESAVQGAGHGW
jgi:transferase CAF17, mitochondrial